VLFHYPKYVVFVNFGSMTLAFLTAFIWYCSYSFDILEFSFCIYVESVICCTKPTCLWHGMYADELLINYLVTLTLSMVPWAHALYGRWGINAPGFMCCLFVCLLSFLPHFLSSLLSSFLMLSFLLIYMLTGLLFDWFTSWLSIYSFQNRPVSFPGQRW